MKNVLLLITMGWVLSSCGLFADPKHNPGGSANTSTIATAEISFTSVREKIFEPHCRKCHAQYVEYDFVKQDLSLILNSVEQDRMPKGGPALSEDLKLFLRQWADAGAPDTAVAVVDEPDILMPIWESLSKKIFTPKCLVCHSPTGEAPWVDFSSRASMHKTLLKHLNFKEPEKSYLVVRLADKEEPMPPLPPFSNIPQLTDEEIAVVIEWIGAYIP